MSPAALIVSGFVILLLGWAAIFLMVVSVLPPSFALALGAYALTFAGMLVGFVGLIEYRRYR